MANYVLLERIELNASAASITFSDIPQTGYTDLKIVISARTATGGPIDMYGRINGDTGSNYTFRQIQGSGSSVGSATGSNTVMLWGTTNGSSDTANTFSSTEIYIPNYTSSSQKSASSESVTENNGTTAYATMRALLWSGTAAITSLSFYNNSSLNFAANSTFSLYGIAAVGTTPVTAPKADGGNVIATDGTYWYHAFLSNGTFTPQVGLSADVLVVAGGGGGGNDLGGGGGGAGGLLGFTSQSLSTTSYTCTVGAGGAVNTTGVDSQFGALTLVKGGGKGATNVSAAQTGGSGGGGSFTTNTSGAAGTSGQGSAGGSGTTSSSYGVGGGGGGQSAVGANAGGSGGAAGGAGSTSYSSWASATSTGASGNYAGGGGGGCYDLASNNRPGGAGGTGGGGTGGYSWSSTSLNATAGTTNTGGGGGGAGLSGSGNGAAGGSGIIIIRYAV